MLLIFRLEALSRKALKLCQLTAVSRIVVNGSSVDSALASTCKSSLYLASEGYVSLQQSDLFMANTF